MIISAKRFELLECHRECYRKLLFIQSRFHGQSKSKLAKLEILHDQWDHWIKKQKSKFVFMKKKNSQQEKEFKELQDIEKWNNKEDTKVFVKNFLKVYLG